jgi:hypothetical protein
MSRRNWDRVAVEDREFAHGTEWTDPEYAAPTVVPAAVVNEELKAKEEMQAKKKERDAKEKKFWKAKKRKISAKNSPPNSKMGLLRWLPQIEISIRSGDLAGAAELSAQLATACRQFREPPAD